MESKLHHHHLKDHYKTLNYKIFASTWNVGGVVPPHDLNLEDWLDTRNSSYDIYVIGFQEIVPLSAKNVLGSEKNCGIAAKWNSLIRSALNRSAYGKGGMERQKVHPVAASAEGSSSGSGRLAQEFQCVVTKQMVGILVSVWARSNISQCIRWPASSTVGCGIMGRLGNKGAVSVRFGLHRTSFCVVCCHLASGGKEGDEAHRNADAVDILSRTVFPRRRLPDLPRTILQHDRVILLGDLNYRISLPEDATRSLVERKQWKLLLENDQLRTELSSGRVFDGWQEGAIDFLPTYKYLPNSDKYYGCLQGKKGQKRRAPAWCDRILWYGGGMCQVGYSRSESRLSDHRPVSAVFVAEVEVATYVNSLRSHFMSERFEAAAMQCNSNVHHLLQSASQKQSSTFSQTV